MILLQKIWKYLTGLMILWAVRIFLHKHLVLVTILVSKQLKDKYQNSFNYKFEPVSTDQVKGGRKLFYCGGGGGGGRGSG